METNNEQPPVVRTSNASRYNCGIATVDIAPVDFDRLRVLLGKKPNQDRYRFAGGFVDPEKDSSIFQAAQRELGEEMGDIEVDSWKSIGNPIIPDSRYASDKDKIFTTFYVCQYIFGSPKAGDDLEEVKWFKLEGLTKEDILPVHHQLYDILRGWLKEAKLD